MSKRRHVGPVIFTEEEWRLHQEMDELLRKQNRIQPQLVARLEEKIRILEGRLPPPPDWVKPNAAQRSEEKRRKRGAVEGHEAHPRPAPLRIDATEEVRLSDRPKCGERMGRPFAIDERLVEAIVPGHVRVTKYRIGRYRCGHCRKF